MGTSELVLKVDAADLGLTHVASGKVREIFELDAATLLFVATDRISAFDVVLQNGIPQKGAILTQLSAHWFDLISSRLPHVATHLRSMDVPSTIPSNAVKLLTRRSMQVRRLEIIPLESIVRGYITGSAWSEYKRSGTVHGMQVAGGLQESQMFDAPIWTPSTKAELGSHDENISEARAVELVGADVASKVKRISLEVYKMAHAYAAERGIIIADTKLEFGFDRESGEIVLVDEVLTPDSSRFWPADQYKVGQTQESYDKQFLRDWLIRSGLKGVDGTAMPDDIVSKTAEKYREAYEKLTGKLWQS